MRTAAAVMFWGLASLSFAQADQLSCDSFKSRFIQAMHDEGRDSGSGEESRPAFQPNGTDPLRFDLSGVGGVQGGLVCSEADAFQSFDIHSEHEGADDREIASRILRLLTVSAAATCVTDPAPTDACNDRVKALFLAGFDSFDQARRRGDQPPGSHRTLDVSPESRAELSLTPDGAFFTLRARQP